MNKNTLKDTFFSKNRSLNCRGKLLSLKVPKIMGILNITPDSFFDGGRYTDPSEALARAEQMLHEGADMIDIGANSSRPGSVPVSPEEEMERLHPVLSELRNRHPELIISLDTFYSAVAKEMYEKYNIDIINDITAGKGDENMIPWISTKNLPYIIMHMQGTPENMQENPVYENVTDEIIRFFAEKVHLLHKKGVSDVLIDPGFGFGKTVDHNYSLLGNSYALQMFKLPVVAGISRKSMITKLLDVSKDEALNGTTAAHMILLQNGVSILRVHDVKEAKQSVEIFLAANNPIK